jgi:predicted acetyltransferase
MTREHSTPKPREHAVALVAVLSHYVAENPCDENVANLHIAKQWLAMLDSGHDVFLARKLLAALDELPTVGAVTLDLRIACRAWLRRGLLLPGARGGPEDVRADRIHLVPPSERYRESFLRALAEFRQEGLLWWLEGDIELAEHDFAAFVARKLADATRRTETLVPKTHLWAVIEEELVGRISIHHDLNDVLRLEGGHIGYDTVPSFRGRGIATEMLRQALPVARALGLTEVLLTCDDTNAASIRVIERNGGSLRETRALRANRPLKRYYWITLS